MKQLFDKLLNISAWFDTQLSRAAWFDDDFGSASSVAAELLPNARYTVVAMPMPYVVEAQNKIYEVAA